MISALPDDFASKLLDKEIELGCLPNLSTLTELTDLYRQAIEYFEHIKSPKFWDMQERLQKILMRPEILSVMREEIRNSSNSHKNRSRAVTHTAVSKKEKRQQFEEKKKMFNTQLQDSGIVSVPNISKLASKLVEKQETSNKKIIQKSVSNLKNQDLSLEERLKLRKQKGLNTSNDSSCFKSSQTLGSPANEDSTSCSFFFEFQDEPSEGKSANQSFQRSDELENEIEKIMEENFIEKSEKVTALKVKYETQINEYSGQGSLYNDVVRDLKGKMEVEIKEICQQLDCKRKEAVSKAKAGHIEIF